MKGALAGDTFMSAAADAAPHHLIDDALARRNALVLACTQALAGANNTVLLATGAITGAMLAPDKILRNRSDHHLCDRAMARHFADRMRWRGITVGGRHFRSAPSAASSPG